MKMVNAFAALLLFVAGCASYPENQYSSTSTYSSQPYYSSTPKYNAPSYTPGVTTAQVLTQADRTLSTTVQRALNENATVAGASRNIYIASRNGTVTLTGTVPTEQDRQFIDNVVRNTSGVYQVNDQMQVIGVPTGAADSRVYATPEPLIGPNSAGTVFNLHVQGLDEPDRSLAQRILQELRTDTILPSLLPVVNITVSGGIVILDGYVQNERQRRAIDTATRRATGGQVENRLQIR
jgi:osmotically-inducible protein OsmY